jgi:hypothetical protein
MKVAADSSRKGVLFIEIAYWKLATRFDEMKAQPLSPWDVKASLVARTAKNLAHMMGQSYANAVEACLRFKELTEELNEYDKHKVFELKVLTVLKRATTTT